MKKKGIVRLALVMAIVAMLAMSFAGCGNGDGGSSAAPAGSSAATDDGSAATTPAADLNIQVIAKGFQHQFWQVVKKGSEEAAAALGVTVTFNGPASESEINSQVDMLNTALAQNPSAIVLAALDTQSVMGQLEDATSKGIPVIGFDSGVPNAPEGAIVATASTDNEAAAALAAERMMADPDFKAAVDAATAEAPVTIAILSQDATSTSIIDRTNGYLNAIKAALEAIHPGLVAVTGHDAYAAPVDGAAVNVLVQVPPTPDADNMRNGATAILGEQNLIGIFCSNEGAVTGLLNATTDGADLGAGKPYENIVVAGFDAGATQKAAVKNGLFLGSVTQDPYQIGYKAVELAVQAANGEAVADVDTGAKWYDATNMEDADIAELIYD